MEICIDIPIQIYVISVSHHMLGVSLYVYIIYTKKYRDVDVDIYLHMRV